MIEPPAVELYERARAWAAADERVAAALVYGSVARGQPLYDAALDRWAARTGKPRPRYPLAPGVLELVHTAVT